MFEVVPNQRVLFQELRTFEIYSEGLQTGLVPSLLLTGLAGLAGPHLRR